MRDTYIGEAHRVSGGTIQVAAIIRYKPYPGGVSMCVGATLFEGKRKAHIVGTSIKRNLGSLDFYNKERTRSHQNSEDTRWYICIRNPVSKGYKFYRTAVYISTLHRIWDGLYQRARIFRLQNLAGQEVLLTDLQNWVPALCGLRVVMIYY